MVPGTEKALEPMYRSDTAAFFIPSEGGALGCVTPAPPPGTCLLPAPVTLPTRVCVTKS